MIPRLTPRTETERNAPPRLTEAEIRAAYLASPERAVDAAQAARIAAIQAAHVAAGAPNALLGPEATPEACVGCGHVTPAVSHGLCPDCTVKMEEVGE